MSIYFLQKLNPPILPILHEIINSKKLTNFSKKNKTTNQSDLNSDFEASTATKTKQRIKTTSLNDTLEEAEYDHDTIDNFNVFRKNLQDYVRYFLMFLNLLQRNHSCSFDVT